MQADGVLIKIFMQVLFKETVWSYCEVEDHNVDALITAIKTNGGIIPEEWFDSRLSTKDEVWDTSEMVAPGEAEGAPTVIIKDEEGETTWSNQVDILASRWISIQDIPGFNPEEDLIKPCLVEVFRPDWPMPMGGITYGVWALIDNEATVNGVPWESLKSTWQINRVMPFEVHDCFFEQHKLK